MHGVKGEKQIQSLLLLLMPLQHKLSCFVRCDGVVNTRAHMVMLFNSPKNTCFVRIPREDLSTSLAPPTISV